MNKIQNGGGSIVDVYSWERAVCTRMGGRGHW